MSTRPAEPARIDEADPASPDARRCLAAYYAELARRFPGGFDVTLSRDPEAQDMIPPRGVFLLARQGDRPVACAGLKGHGHWGEVKRLWVAPEARGAGLAGRLMARIETAARGLGMALLRLDTNAALPEAAALHRKAGWTAIDRFNDDPYAQLFFEKHL